MSEEEDIRLTKEGEELANELEEGYKATDIFIKGYNQALKDAKEGVKHILSLYEYIHQCKRLNELFEGLKKK